MLGCVVKLQPLGDPPSLLCRERLVQLCLAMTIQVVHDQPDHRDIGIGLVHQPAHRVGEVLFGTQLLFTAACRLLSLSKGCQGLVKTPFRPLQIPPVHT